MPTRLILVLAALAAFLTASAAEPVAVVTGPGDQSAPSVSGVRIAYTDDASGARQILVRDLTTGISTRITDDRLDYGEPDLARTSMAFTGPDGVHLVPIDAIAQAMVVAAPGAAHASYSGQLLAWDQTGEGGRDIGLLPEGATTPTIVSGPGDEHDPSTAFGWVAWLDEAGAGAIRLRDAAGAVTTPWSGRAGRVSLWASSPLTAPILAADVDGAGGDRDLVVLDSSGLERARLALPGLQRRPTLFGEWVGFEDLATGVSQVALWQWSTGRVVYPSPSQDEQLLNDVVVSDSGLQLAWADRRGGDLDIYLFSTTLPLPDVPPGQVRCDDPLAPVVADFALLARRHRVTSGAVHFEVPAQAPALACVDAVEVEQAWIEVGETLIELPRIEVAHHPPDRHPGGDRHRRRSDRAVSPCLDPSPTTSRHVEQRLVLPAGQVLAGAVMVADSGATLRVRVLADGWQAPVRQGCLAGVDCPPPSPPPGGPHPGCASGGAAGALGLLLVGLGLAGRRAGRRRPASPAP